MLSLFHMKQIFEWTLLTLNVSIPDQMRKKKTYLFSFSFLLPKGFMKMEIFAAFKTILRYHKKRVKTYIYYVTSGLIYLRFLSIYQNTFQIYIISRREASCI